MESIKEMVDGSSGTETKHTKPQTNTQTNPSTKATESKPSDQKPKTKNIDIDSLIDSYASKSTSKSLERTPTSTNSPSDLNLDDTLPLDTSMEGEEEASPLNTSLVDELYREDGKVDYIKCTNAVLSQTDMGRMNADLNLKHERGAKEAGADAATADTTTGEDPTLGEEESAGKDTEVWCDYTSSIPYGIPHPGDIVEAASMSAVHLPDVEYPLQESLAMQIESGKIMKGYSYCISSIFSLTCI